MAVEPLVIVLAIDTATPAVTAGVVRLDDVALRRDRSQGCENARSAARNAISAKGRVLAQRVTVDARAHAETLTPNVLAALADSNLTFADLDAVVVGCGPGPFTGLRVGMASAAAIGHALGLPVYGACSLDAIGLDTSGATTGDVLVVTDARRREVYWALYRDGVRVDGPAVDAPADVPSQRATAVAGSPDHAAMFDLPRLAATYPTPDGLARAVADWASPPDALRPLYLRRPDAKSLAERTGGQAPSDPGVDRAVAR